MDSQAQVAVKVEPTLAVRAIVPVTPAIMSIQGLGANGTTMDVRTRFGIVPPPPLDSMRQGDLELSDIALPDTKNDSVKIAELDEGLLHHISGPMHFDAAHRRIGLYWQSYGVSATHSEPDASPAATRRRAEEGAGKAEQQDRLQRLATAGAVSPGLPFVKPNTIVVAHRRAVFMYLEPDVTVGLAKGDRFGFYVWRWHVNDGVKAFSLVFAADTALRTSNFCDIVKAGCVRRCASIFETSAMACPNPGRSICRATRNRVSY